MYFAACVLTMNENGEILAVSRKDDKEDFGLPGGKVEPGETPVEAALRELNEETGYQIVDPRYINMIYHRQDPDGKLTVTYEVPFGALKKVKNTTEDAVVAWIKPDTLARGKAFGEYNRGLLKTVGIKFNTGYMPAGYSIGNVKAIKNG